MKEGASEGGRGRLQLDRVIDFKKKQAKPKAKAVNFWSCLMRL